MSPRPNQVGVRRRARRWIARAAGGLGALLLVAGLLHTGPGVRLMVRMGVACPARAVTPAQAAALRAEGLRSLRGSRPAPARYARGLTLGVSGEAAARALALGDGEACTRKQRGFGLLICARDGARSGPRSETTYAFDERDRLISIDVMTRVADGEVARAFGERAAALARALGEDGERAGDAGEVARGRALFATAIVRHRFSDYFAALSAVRLADGVAVREQYQSLVGGPAS